MTLPYEQSVVSSDHGAIALYQAKDGQTTLDVQLKDETVWLTQAQMGELFQRDQSVISRHVHNVFKEGELPKQSNMQKMHIALASIVRFDDKALVALALLIAASDPPRKELMIRLIVNLLDHNRDQNATGVSGG